MANLLQRITSYPQILHGKPTIRGLRISVEMILGLLAKGASEQEILEDYPELEPEDIQAVLFYAHSPLTQGLTGLLSSDVSPEDYQKHLDDKYGPK
jgi:uncharacterized protein (DUF433 family)